MDVLYLSVLVFLLVIVGFVIGSLAASKLLQTQGPASTDKMTTYECGERPMGPAWFNFNPRFYVIAIVFVIVFLIVFTIVFVIVRFRRRFRHRVRDRVCHRCRYRFRHRVRDRCRHRFWYRVRRTCSS